MKPVLLLCIVVVALCYGTATASALGAGSFGKGTGIRMKRAPHRHTPNGLSLEENKKNVLLGGRKSAGTTIPMNGGVLTFGAYFLEMEVGSGAGKQTYDVIVDTGSSNTAVPSVGCTTCGTQQLYNATASTTSKPLSCTDPMCTNCKPIVPGTNTLPANSTEGCLYGEAVCYHGQCGFGFAYGGGGTGTEGTIVTDVACLSNGSLCTTIYLDQLEAEYPRGTQTAGILGLAYGAVACNPTCQPTILDQLVANEVITKDEDKFGMCLSRSNGGMLDFGAINPDRYESGTMQYAPLASESFYSITVKDLQIGGKSIGVPPLFYRMHNDLLGSFVDSGTSIVLVSTYAFGKIVDAMTEYPLPGVNTLFAEGNCFDFANHTDAIDKYPTFTFIVKGVKGDFGVSMNGTNYLMPASPGSTTRCLGIAGITSIGAILGDVIMENYYIAFDRQQGQIGFAPVTNCN